MLDSNPRWDAALARPFDPHEIDEHPDARRIWATIRAMQGEHADAIDYHEAEVEKRIAEAEEAAADEAHDGGREEAVGDLRHMLRFDVEFDENKQPRLMFHDPAMPEDMRAALEPFARDLEAKLADVMMWRPTW